MPKSFQNLVAFQRALDLMVEVYEITATFPKTETFGLASQLRRAAVGVVSQIAEGDGRLTYGELRQFLSQARGSLFEVEAQLIAAHRLGFFNDSTLDRVQSQVRRTGSALVGLIRWVQREDAAKRRRYPVPTRPRDPATQQRTPQPG
jgi:four helix bundle protein